MPSSPHHWVPAASSTPGEGVMWMAPPGPVEAPNPMAGSLGSRTPFESTS